MLNIIKSRIAVHLYLFIHCLINIRFRVAMFALWHLRLERACICCCIKLTPIFPFIISHVALKLTLSSYFYIFKTKTVQVKPNETAEEIVNRCKYLFNLDSPENSSTYQLWLKTGKNEPILPLTGKDNCRHLKQPSTQAARFIVILATSKRNSRFRGLTFVLTKAVVEATIKKKLETLLV